MEGRIYNLEIAREDRIPYDRIHYGPLPKLTLACALAAGWERVRDNLGAAIGGLLLFEVVHIAGSIIPFLNILFAILIFPPLIGGAATLFLNIARGADAGASDVFRGFRKYGQFMGAYWLFFLIVLGCAAPALLTVLMAEQMMKQLGGSLDNSGAMVFVMLSAGLLLAVAAKWFGFPFVVADDEPTSATKAFQTASSLTAGHRVRLAWITVGLVLFSFCGLLLLLVGVILTSAISGVAGASVYLTLKSRQAGGKEAHPEAA